MQAITLDALVVVGVLVNLIKTGDLLLRPHQQQRLQRAFETLTLRLDYARPLTWFSKLGRAESRRILLVLVCLFTIWQHIFYIIIGLPFSPDEMPSGGWAVQLAWFVVSSAIGVGLILCYGSRVVRWLFSEPSYLKFLKRYALLVAAAVAAYFVWSFVGIFVAGFTEKFLSSSAQEFSVSRFLALMFFINAPANVVFILCLSIGVVLWNAFFVCLALESVLKILRGLTWRIAEYNRGVVAALVLVTTVVLGVADWYLKFFR